MSRNFDGVDDGASTASGAGLGPWATRTQFVWFKPDRLNKVQTIVRAGERTGASGTELEDGLSLLSGGTLRWYVAASGLRYVAASGTPTVGAWNWAAGRRDGTAIKVWLNGTATATTMPSSNVDSVSDNFMVGKSLAFSNEEVDGLIAHVARWSSALSDADVALLGGGANPLAVSPATLVGYWSFTDNTTATEPDLGTSGTPLTITGAVVSADNPTVDAPPGGGATELVPVDAGHAHTADPVTLTQVHQLTPASVGHGHVADASSLTQTYALASDPAGHGHTADAGALTQAHALAPAETVQPHTADLSGLTQVHVLTATDTAHVHTADATELTGAGSLDPSDTDHGHTANTTTLTQVHAFAPDGADHGNTAEPTALTQIHALTPAGTTHGHTAEASSLPGEIAAHELLLTSGGELQPEWSFTPGTPATGTINTSGGYSALTIPDGARTCVFATGDTDATAGITRAVTGSIDYAVQIATDIKGDGGIGVNLLLSGAAGEDVLACLFSTTLVAQGYGFTRAGGSGASYVNAAFTGRNAGHGAWIRLTYDAGTGAVTFRHSADGATWTTHGTATRAITPATFKIGLSSTTPNLGGTVRLRRVVDMTALGGADTRDPIDYTRDAPTLTADFTAGIPAWLTTHTTGNGSATATGGALRLSSGTNGTANISGAQAVANTGALANVGLTGRARWAQAGDGDLHYAVFALGVDEGGIDQYARGAAYVIEPNEENTALRFLRVSKPTSNDNFEEPYTFLADLPTGTGQAPGTWARYRLERFGPRVRFRVWADGAAEPSTWVFDGEDPVHDGPLGAGFAMSRNLSRVVTVPAQWDVDDVEFYGLTSAAPTEVTFLPADTTHGHATDAAALTQVHQLAPNSTSHGHTADAAALTQAHDLDPTPTGHGHTADPSAIFLTTLLIPAPAVHGHIADVSGLDQAHALAPATALHPHTADLAVLTQLHVLAPAEAAHPHAADMAALLIGLLTTPAERTLTVPAENRTMLVHAESRTITA